MSTDDNRWITDDTLLAGRLAGIADQRIAERGNALVELPEWTRVLIGDGHQYVLVNRHKPEGRPGHVPPWGVETGRGPMDYSLTHVRHGAPTNFVHVYLRHKLVTAPQKLSDDFFSHLSSWPVCPPIARPYGYVNDDRTVQLIYFLSMEKAQPPHDGSTAHLRGDIIGAWCFVRRDATIPEPLIQTDSSYTDWLTRFWALVDAGRIVRMSAILRGARSVPFFGGGGVCPYIRIEGPAVADGQPEIADNTEYLLWHPKERYAGQLFSHFWGGPTSKREVLSDMKPSFE